MSNFASLNLPFLPSLFKANYPQFATCTDNQLNELFNNLAVNLGSWILSIFQGGLPTETWNASTNTPHLENGVLGDQYSYLCTVGGTVDFGAGDIVFSVYDIPNYNNYTKTWQNKGQPTQYYWYGVVLAHILTLLENPTAVGRVASAGEGSVSAGMFDYKSTQSSTWWNQNQYGAMCWKMMQKRGGATYFAQASYNGYVI